MSGIYIQGIELPKGNSLCLKIYPSGGVTVVTNYDWTTIMKNSATAISVPAHGIPGKRIVYRGEVYNALEAARINSLDGILTDPYKEGFHDGIKRALQILANEVNDAPAIILADHFREATKWCQTGRACDMAKRSGFLFRMEQEKERYARAAVHWSEQNMMDLAAVALNEQFGFGADRLEKFNQAMEALHDEYATMWNADTADTEYSKAVLDRKLKEIYGEKFVPWKKRYS